MNDLHQVDAVLAPALTDVVTTHHDRVAPVLERHVTRPWRWCRGAQPEERYQDRRGPVFAVGPLLIGWRGKNGVPGCRVDPVRAGRHVVVTEEDVREATRVMRQEADVSIDSEVDNLEKESISEMKEIRNKASKNIDEAVSYIFNQVLEASAHS